LEPALREALAATAGGVLRELYPQVRIDYDSHAESAG